MKKLKCIIIEDEKMSRDILSEYIQKQDGIELVAEFESGEDFIQNQFDVSVIDVIFLDIEMPFINGFDLLDQLAVRPYIVVTTSHKDYAIKGFEYNVNDFMLKPFTYPNFHKSLNKIFDHHRDSLEAKDIFVKVDGNLVRIEFNDILYLEAGGDYVLLHTAEERQVTRLTMKEVENALPSYFMRIHRSYIINTEKIDKIEDNVLIMDKHLIPISRNYKTALLQRINLLGDSSK